MAQNEPEKNIPSTAAKATNLSPKLLFGLFDSPIHFNAQSAFFFTQGIVSNAKNNLFFLLCYEYMYQLTMNTFPNEYFQ